MDIYGRALLDRQAGRDGPPITIRRDDGHTDTHGAAFYFQPDPMPNEAALLADAREPVLDVGCGAGRSILSLTALGLDAYGVDASPGAVRVCRARGCRHVTEADVMTNDLPDDWPAFATVLLFGNNIGIGGTPEGVVRLLRRLRGWTTAEARVLLTAIDVERTDDPRHLANHARNRAAGRPPGQIEIRLEYNGAIGPWHRWLHPTPEELETFAGAAGWRLGRIVGVGAFYGAVLRATPWDETHG
ncbi:MAG: methyltransferase domain-containing protein [Pseudomonadota bacterium]